MKTIPFIMRGIGLSILTVLLLSTPATAQDDSPPDTIRVDGNSVVIEFGEDGQRVHIGDGYLSGIDGPRVFHVGPGKRSYSYFNDDSEDWEDRYRNFSVTVPKVQVGRHGVELEDFLTEHVAKLEDGNVWFDGLTGRISGDWGASMEMQRELSKLEAESRRLARDIRKAEADDRTRLSQELEDKLDEIFEKKLELKEERADRLRKELNEALGDVEERRKVKEEVIQRRLRHLLGEDDLYDW